jgi:hypothetical protein
VKAISSAMRSPEEKSGSMMARSRAPSPAAVSGTAKSFTMSWDDRKETAPRMASFASLTLIDETVATSRSGEEVVGVIQVDRRMFARYGVTTRTD